MTLIEFKRTVRAIFHTIDPECFSKGLFPSDSPGSFYILGSMLAGGIKWLQRDVSAAKAWLNLVMETSTDDGRRSAIKKKLEELQQQVRLIGRFEHFRWSLAVKLGLPLPPLLDTRARAHFKKRHTRG